MKLGVQLYTLRDYCKNLEDLSQTLKKVADIGYKYVQLSGICDYEAQWMKDELDKNGLTAVLTHISAQKLLEETEKVMQDHKILGCKYIGIGMYEMSRRREDYDEFVKNFKPVAEKFKENGFYFMYHNHNMEFAKLEGESKTVMQMLLEEFDSSIFGVTVDTYWIQFAGGFPDVWIEKMAGRVPCIHLKDMVMHLKGEKGTSSEHRTAPVGDGNMCFDSIMEASVKSGVEYAIVEQDKTFDENPFDCVKKSYDYLTSHYEFD